MLRYALMIATGVALAATMVQFAGCGGSSSPGDGRGEETKTQWVRLAVSSSATGAPIAPAWVELWQSQGAGAYRFFFQSVTDQNGVLKLKVSALPAGTYMLEISAHGYCPWRGQLAPPNPDAGEEIAQPVPLEPKGSMRLSLHCGWETGGSVGYHVRVWNTETSQVVGDADEVGDTTLVLDPALPPGIYTIVVQAQVDPCPRVFRGHFELLPGETLPVECLIPVDQQDQPYVYRVHLLSVGVRGEPDLPGTDSELGVLVMLGNDHLFPVQWSWTEAISGGTVSVHSIGEDVTSVVLSSVAEIRLLYARVQDADGMGAVGAPTDVVGAILATPPYPAALSGSEVRWQPEAKETGREAWFAFRLIPEL